MTRGGLGGGLGGDGEKYEVVYGGEGNASWMLKRTMGRTMGTLIGGGWEPKGRLISDITGRQPTLTGQRGRRPAISSLLHYFVV